MYDLTSGQPDISSTGAAQKAFALFKSVCLALVLCLTLATGINVAQVNTAQAQPAFGPIPEDPIKVDLYTWYRAILGHAPSQNTIMAQTLRQDIYAGDQIFDEPNPPTPIPLELLPGQSLMTFNEMLAMMPGPFHMADLVKSALDGNAEALEALQASLPDSDKKMPPDGPIIYSLFPHRVANTIVYRIALGSERNSNGQVINDSSMLGTLLNALDDKTGALNVLTANYGAPDGILASLASRIACGASAEYYPPTREAIQDAMNGDDLSYRLIRSATYTYLADPSFSDKLLTAGRSYLTTIMGEGYVEPLEYEISPRCQIVGQDEENVDELTLEDLDEDFIKELVEKGVDPQEWLDEQNARNSQAAKTYTPSGAIKLSVEDSGPGPENNDDCDNTGATLTEDDFGSRDPCTWTRDNRNLEYAQKHQAGWKFIEYLADWSATEFIPMLKGFAANMHAAYVDQTMQFGLMYDAISMGRVKSMHEQREVESNRAADPNANSCSVASQSGSQANAARTGADLEAVQLRELQMRSSSKGAGPAGDMATRFARFCEFFVDPDANGGGWDKYCGDVTPSSHTIPDADVNVESFLLKDTIDFNNPAERSAATAMMENLIEPQLRRQINPSALQTLGGPQEILNRQHIATVRAVAAGVVAGVISRRASITNTASAAEIRDIRTKAGIEPGKISTSPSYNEIMLALTKEKFFDPSYFVTMSRNEGAIKKEQTLVNAYIALQLQDIYTLQEQINALMVARSSLDIRKGRTNPRPNEGINRPLQD